MSESYLMVLQMHDRLPVGSARRVLLDIIAGEVSMFDEDIELLVGKAKYFAAGSEQEAADELNKLEETDVEITDE